MMMEEHAYLFVVQITFSGYSGHRALIPADPYLVIRFGVLGRDKEMAWRGMSIFRRQVAVSRVGKEGEAETRVKREKEVQICVCY